MENSTQSCDVCIICASSEEARAFREAVAQQFHIPFTSFFDPKHKDNYYSATLNNDRGEPLVLSVFWSSRSGPVEMGLYLRSILDDWQPRICVMTGICAGDATYVQLGDLIVAERTFTYDNGKFTLDDDGRKVYQPDTATYQVNHNILHFLGDFDAWKPLVAQLRRPSSPHQQSRKRKITCHIKPMASGSAVRADQPFEEIRVPVRSLVALDRESAALGYVMQYYPLIPWLVVKGVSNHANSAKNEVYSDYASQASALYAFSFIRAYVTDERLPRRSRTKVWTIPQIRNPYFTGREDLLKDLHEMLNDNQIVSLTYIPHAPRALSGLGGIGKTQAAIEYAYRYRNEYETVLWIKADTSVNILSSFVNIANLLDLPEKSAKNPQLIVAAVKKWLEDHTRWLLIFDNADDLDVVQDYLPLTTNKDHHTLITTRAYAVGRVKAWRVEINTLEEDEGVSFLLHRAGILQPSDDDRHAAREIVREVGGLPLALEQAGAYIEETGMGISQYLELYRTRRDDLLKHQEPPSPDYPHTVATVWSLSFDKVMQANPAATELLSLCAFLDPDAIPEEMIAAGGQTLGPIMGPISSDPIRLNAAIKELRRFSLIRHNTHLLTIHRLVQFVIRDNMNKETQSIWADRAIHMLHLAFPTQANDPKNWTQCQRYLPHARACANFINPYGLASQEAGRLLNQVGYYLREQARYGEAEPFLKQALEIRQQVLGPKHSDTAESLNNLARLYFDQYEYAKAEPLYEQARQIREELLKQADIDTVEKASRHVAVVFNSLALNYWYEQKYAEAEALYDRAFPISQQKFGPEHGQTLLIQNNIALLYRSQRKYQEAIELNKYVLEIRERKFGPVHLEVAQSLQNLAVTYYEQGDQNKYEEAESLLKRALDIRKQLLPEKHLQTARCLRYLALVYKVQGKHKESKECFQKAVEMREILLEKNHKDSIEIMQEYADLLREMHQEDEATAVEERIRKSQEEKIAGD